MSNYSWQQVETIIDQVLELPEEKRQSFIEEQCQDNQELKGEITQLLESIADSEGWLDNPDDFKQDFYKELSDEIERLSASRSLIGQQIGAYTIRDKIGEGGMGSVFRAERNDGSFKHCVAIKIIRQEQATSKNIQRFRREQQILAGLSHPGIARLYDGGITEDGFPYIIMEYVDGRPIDEYCRQQKLSVEQKTELFEAILEAVRYAHENLVVHRDLKPANILVDTSGSIKILDFGISRLIEEDEDHRLTQTTGRLLTPRYAAPEQIRQEKLTTSCDLYALGIIFYNLLTDAFPFDFEGCSHYETEQAILTAEPAKPSSKAATTGIRNQLKGDLDAIILKSIRKNPEDRYRGITEFLDDLQHYRHNLPVHARRDSTYYRINKFFKRHKKGIAVAAGVVSLLIGLTSFYTWQVAKERDQARQQAERAEEITNFLVTILKLNNPSQNSGHAITVNDALRRGMDYIGRQTMSDFNRATILGTIGSIQINTGDLEAAGSSLEKAMRLVTDSLARQSGRTLAIGTEYAEWQELTGHNKKAEQIFQLTDSLFQVHGLSQSQNYLKHLLNYSDFLMEIGRYEQALDVLSRSRNYFRSAEDERSPGTDLKGDLYNNLGRAYKNMGQNDKALANLERALELKKQIYDADNPKIGKLYHNMGVVYATTGQNEKAMEMAKKAYSIRTQAFGPDHRLVGSTLHLMGNVALALKRYDEAFDYIKKSLAINRTQHGPQHFRYAFAIREYAKALAQTGRYREAEKQIEKATAIILNNYGREHAYYGYLAYTHATIYGTAGNFKKALEYGEQSIINFRKNFGDRHPNLGKALLQQGGFALKAKKTPQADSLVTSALQILKSYADSTNPMVRQADSLLKIIHQSK